MTVSMISASDPATFRVVRAATADATEITLPPGTWRAVGLPNFAQFGDEIVRITAADRFVSSADATSLTVNLAPTDTTATVVSTSTLYGSTAFGLEQRVGLFQSAGSILEYAFVTDVLDATRVTLRRPTPSTTTITTTGGGIDVVEGFDRWTLRRGQTGTPKAPLAQYAQGASLAVLSDAAAVNVSAYSKLALTIDTFTPTYSFYEEMSRELLSPYGWTGSFEYSHALVGTATLAANMLVMPSITSPQAAPVPITGTFRIRRVADAAGSVIATGSQPQWSADTTVDTTSGFVSMINRTPDSPDFTWNATEGAVSCATGGIYWYKATIDRAAVT